MNVANLKLGARPLQATRAEAGEPPLVGQLAQGIRLVHERAELVAAEEALDRGADRLDREDDARQEVLLVRARHSFACDLFHSHESESKLALQQLTYRANTLVTKIVDVVSLGVLAQVGGHRPEHAGEVVAGQVPDVGRDRLAHSGVEESAADLA